MHRVVLFAIRGKDAVDTLLRIKNNQGHKKPISPFQDTKEALDVLPHALQPKDPGGVIAVY